MKKYTLILLVLLFMPLKAEVNILVKTSIIDYEKGENGKGIANFLESAINSSLRKEFSCSDVINESDIATMITFDRAAVLLGNESHLESIGSRASHNDFLVTLKITRTKQGVYFAAKCLNPIKAKVMAEKFEEYSKDEEAVKKAQKFADDFIREMTYLEICPYKGSINIDISSSRDNTSESSIPVFCNGEGKTQKIINKVHTTTDVKWKLNKLWWIDTEGDVTWSISENYNDIDENDCYTCKSGRTGGRTSNKTRTVKYKGNGIPEKKGNNKIYYHLAVTNIKFEKNGTYSLIVKTVSLKGEGEMKIEEKIEGTCDLSGENKTIPTEKQIFLEIPLGPFNGNPWDKTLSGKGTIDLPQSADEKVKCDYDFTLSR